MNQHDFDILLQKYLSGKCSREEELQVQQWTVHMLSDSKIPLSISEQNSIKNKQWNRLRRSALRKGAFNFKSIYVRYGMAAALVLVSGLVFFLARPMFRFKQAHPVTKAQTSGDDVENLDYIKVKNVGNSERIVLEDGSIVVLKKQSSISYPKHFDNKNRKVHLEGEAFFTVKKDRSRPFMVYTGELVTQVLGTSFNVRSYDVSKAIEVQVVSGRVSVYENEQKGPQNRNGVILNPNQKVTFDKETKKLVPGLVEVPVLVSVPETKNIFEFEEVLLPKVLQTLQAAYNIEIVVETPTLDACVFTGDLNNLPLHSKLKLICKSVSGSYELRGTTFFIRGEGCAH